MAYQIRCNDSVLYDPRDDDLIVKSPKCKLGVNTVGEASFTILANHPHYGELTKLRSVFEIKQDGQAIFRGRITDESKDFDNMKQVDLEGAMAYFNDSMVRPFSFPNDFLEDSDYVAASEESAEQAAMDGGVVRFFLKALIDNHNAQVQPFQQFKLGKVTVSDPNNYVTKDDSGYKKTWEILREKLFESSLGGYLCIRYEDDGNYIDYLADFEQTSTQTIEFGENLLDIVQESDATETYSAIIPLGKKGDNNSEALTIESLDDGNVTDDIVKKGDTLYSKSAVAKYGWIYAPVSETTWEDVTKEDHLQSKGVDYLEKIAMSFYNTVTITALDLHLADAEIEAFRMYRYINVVSIPHAHVGRYSLTELDIDMENPQNTKITIGETKRALTDKTSSTANRVSVMEAKNNTTNKTIAELEKKTADNEASITSLTEWQGETNDSIAKIEQNVSKNNADISLVVTDGKADAELLIAAINGESSAKILADRLDIEGKTLNIKVASTNVEGQLTAGQIDVTNLSVYAAKIKGQLQANQLSINDLSALNATIGGVNVSDDGMYCEAPPIETPISDIGLNNGGTFKVVLEPNSGGACVFTIDRVDSLGNRTNVVAINVESDGTYEEEFTLNNSSTDSYEINYELYDYASAYSLYSVDYSNYGGWGLFNTDVPTDVVFYAGKDYADRSEAPFKVFHSGDVLAKKILLGEKFSYSGNGIFIAGDDLHVVLKDICDAIVSISNRVNMS